MDGYHYPQSRLVALGRRDRMGAPDTFDVEAFLGTLRDLQISGGTVFAPGFDREIEEPVPDAIALQPELATVVVEGNYLLLDDPPWSEVAGLLDFTIFIDVPAAELHRRLMERWARYGKSEAEARHWVDTNDAPNIRRVLEGSRPADVRVTPSGQDAASATTSGNLADQSWPRRA